MMNYSVLLGVMGANSKMSAIDQLLDGIFLPRMVRIKQQFEKPFIKDIEGELIHQLHTKEVLQGLQPGARIAVALGSRGISNLPLLVKILIREIKAVGADPFIVPAMGSHAGATAEGQREMLIGLGIQEEYVDAPIRATMEVVQVGVAENGLPVYVDRFAYEADGIILVNRIKPHTSFRGKYESGLMKMITIGLGKQKGADICHELGFGKMAENIPAIARVTLEKTKLLFGVGLLENAYHETCQLAVLTNTEIAEKEPALQEEAKRLSPSLCFDQLDVLIIDEIGKDISGTGFDPNIVGRYNSAFASGGPNITKISILDVTERSHGNANGLGIADFTTRRAFDKFSMEQTYPNALTSTVPLSVKIPMALKSDKQAIQAAVKTCNILNKQEVRLVRIKNTLELGELEISENLLPEVQGNPYLEVISEPYSLNFDSQGNLVEG